MAHNPLLGSRISLISKKNIRYEGTLYSINETDATVALQNVRSYGTEDRETDTFAAPQDQVHPYLLFRGCDIKDLHVHESSTGAGADKPPSDPAIVSSDKPPEIEEHDEDTSKKVHKDIEPAKSTKQDHCEGRNKEEAAPAPAKAMSMAKPRRNKNTNQNRPKQMVGNGASLLNRKARGVVDGADGPDKDMEKDFDFESNLAEFAKEEDDDDVSYEEEEDAGAYSKDDFFDSISNDALDRQSGFDNRLRGASERTLNTETFGATSLGNNRRFRKRGGGRGGRGRGGRGTGRGRGREGGRRQYGDGRMASTGGRSSNNSREGERRQYGDGGISGTGGGGSHGVREGGGRRQYGDGGISSTGGEGSNGAWRTVN